MVTQQQWREYVELAQYLQSFDTSELPFALTLLVGPPHICGNGSRKYALPSELEFWIHPGYVNRGRLEYSYISYGIKSSVEELEATFRDHIDDLEIG